VRSANASAHELMPVLEVDAQKEGVAVSHEARVMPAEGGSHAPAPVRAPLR
jgi:hypothetical protein